MSTKISITEYCKPLEKLTITELAQIYWDEICINNPEPIKRLEYKLLQRVKSGSYPATKQKALRNAYINNIAWFRKYKCKNS